MKKKTVWDALEVITGYLFNSRWYWFLVGWTWGIATGALLANLI